MAIIARTLDEALESITDGCMLAVPRESSGVPMAATRALIRRGGRRLHLVALPTSKRWKRLPSASVNSGPRRVSPRRFLPARFG
jgi:acyl CoA:acetate/3-ketoacid CoA transferase alpha subunit